MTFYAKKENIKLSPSLPYVRRKRNHRCKQRTEAGGSRQREGLGPSHSPLLLVKDLKLTLPASTCVSRPSDLLSPLGLWTHCFLCLEALFSVSPSALIVLQNSHQASLPASCLGFLEFPPLVLYFPEPEKQISVI